MPLRAVFFDLDGTLLDTARDLTAALDKIMIEDGLTPPPFEESRLSVSNGSYALVKLGYGLGDDEHERTHQLRQRLLDHYLPEVCVHTKAYPGIAELIQHLADRDICWGIATNKPWAYAKPLMQQIHFASDPVCILCPDHVAKPKPDPESLFLACEAAQCKIDEAIYIGDHLRDIECARQAGMASIAVKYGYIHADLNVEDWRADHMVENASDIWPLLTKHYL